MVIAGDLREGPEEQVEDSEEERAVYAEV